MDSPQSQEHYPTDTESSRLPRWLTDTPYWAISSVVHVLLVLLIGSWVLIDRPEEKPPKRSEISLVKPKKKRPEGRKPSRKPQPPTLTPPSPHPVTDVVEPVEPTLPTTPNPKKTDPSLIQNVFGPSGMPSGSPYIGRLSAGKTGGDTYDAVLASLRWLKRHQHPDGHWSAADYFPQCKDPDHPCKLKSPGYVDGRGFEGYDVGVTALALLAFLGNGHTHELGAEPEFRDTVKRAKNWLIAQQVRSDDPRLDGVIGKSDAEEWVYNHAIATMALSELLLLSRDTFGKLPRVVERATRYILRAQNEGYGWKYDYSSGKNDTSVTGWMVLALKASKLCSRYRMIKIKTSEYTPAFTGALAWFERCTSTHSGVTGYESPGDPGSSLRAAYPDPYPYSKDLSCMTAVSVLCRILAGQKRKEPRIRDGVEVLRKELPVWRLARGKRKSKINLYYWYYASYALFQYGGRAWDEWNEAMQEALMDNQRNEGCEHGSWDPVGEWGAAGGRVYATALGAMTLEVYYRFARQQSP